jgi:hypothetical protein
MLSIGVLSPVCSLVAGIYSFAPGAPPDWNWGKGLFVIFLLPAAACFVANALRRPSLMWEMVDDIHGH